MDSLRAFLTMTMRCGRTGLFVLALLAAAPVAAADDLSWFDQGQPSGQAWIAIDRLRDAAAVGLDPEDYDAARLGAALQELSRDPATDQVRAWFDTELTGAMQRYLTDLQSGRIDPRELGARFMAPRRKVPDIAEFLRASVAERRLDQAIQRLAQRQPASGPLLDALAFYRAMAPDKRWQTALPLPRGGKLVTGQSYPAMDELARRLTAFGDLAQGPESTLLAQSPLFEGPLVAALERFQLRHGLERDGVLGRRTLAQLNVTPGQRVRQIELTLERQRWTPYLQAPRMVVVNLPEFVLRAYEVLDQDRIDLQLTMKVIVGKTLDTRTPLFDEDMRFIEFSPYWNVPRSIATRELVPRLRKDPGHFYDQGFEFVTDRRTVVGTLAEAHLDAVMQGTWRIRQRPGPKNALGDIKFVFPNDTNIFLHHTPATRLFSRQRRDLSHGCVRVEAPVALARFVLRDEPEWTDERIREAMELGKSRTIRLRDPLPVLIAYDTVVVKDGMVHFFQDLYGHDAALDQALHGRSQALLNTRRQGAVGG